MLGAWALGADSAVLLGAHALRIPPSMARTDKFDTPCGESVLRRMTLTEKQTNRQEETERAREREKT